MTTRVLHSRIVTYLFHLLAQRSGGQLLQAIRDYNIDIFKS